MVSLTTSGSQPSEGLLPKADQRKADDNQNVGDNKVLSGIRKILNLNNL